MFDHITNLLSKKKKDESASPDLEAQYESAQAIQGRRDLSDGRPTVFPVSDCFFSPADSNNNSASNSIPTQSEDHEGDGNPSDQSSVTSQAAARAQTLISGDHDNVNEGGLLSSLRYSSDGRIYFRALPPPENADADDTASEYFEIIGCDQLDGYTKALDRSNNPGRLETLKHIGVKSINKVKNMSTDAVSEQLGKFSFTGNANKSIQFAEPTEKPELLIKDFDRVSFDHSGEEHEFHPVGSSSSIYSGDDDDDTYEEEPGFYTARTSFASEVDDNHQSNKFSHHRDTLARLPHGFKRHPGNTDRDSSPDSMHSAQESLAVIPEAEKSEQIDVKEEGNNANISDEAAATPDISAYAVADDFLKHVSWYLKPSSVTYQVIVEGYLGNAVIQHVEKDFDFWKAAMMNDKFLDAARVVADMISSSSIHMRVSANAAGARTYRLGGPVEIQYIALLEKAVQDAVPYI